MSSEPSWGSARSLTTAAGSLPSCCLPAQTLSILSLNCGHSVPKAQPPLTAPPTTLDAIILLPKALQGLATAIAQSPSPTQRPWASLHTLPGPTSPARFPSLQALLTALLPQTLSAYSHLPPPHLLAPTTWAFPPQLAVSILDFGLVPLHHISQYPSCSPRDGLATDGSLLPPAGRIRSGRLRCGLCKPSL